AFYRLGSARAPKLAIVRAVLDPMEAAADELQAAAVEQAQGGGNAMAVHGAGELEVHRGGLRKRERGAPVLVARLGEGNGMVREIDGGGVAAGGVVHRLHDHRGGAVEYHPTPTGGVGEQRRVDDAVERERLHLPDAVERRL